MAKMIISLNTEIAIIQKISRILCCFYTVYYQSKKKSVNS